MLESRPVIGLVSISLCLLAISLAFMHYYGEVFEPSPVLNTNMKFWSFDPATNLTKPYLWELDLIKGASDNVSVFSFEVGGREATGLEVFRTNQNTTSVWTTIHLRQDLRGRALDAVFRSRISLWVYPTFPYWFNKDSRNPENAFGVEINDGTNLLWYMFSDGPSQVFQLPRHRIVLVHSPLNEWALREVDISQQFAEAGWMKPDSVSFILILGTTWVHPGRWVGYVSGLSVDIGPLKAESLSWPGRFLILTGDVLVILALASLTVLTQRRKDSSKHRRHMKGVGRRTGKALSI